MNQREIKFRAWDLNYKRMFVPEAISNDGKAVILFSKNEGRKYDIPVMQFTGLKDKNGKEIYEGDIMKDDDGNVYPVVWINAGFYLDGWLGEGVSEDDFEDCEIIGNIYENPELLI